MTRAVLLLACLFAMTSSSANPRAGRPMVIHRLPELNLEIWTEQDPEWETQLSENGAAKTFVAETPALAYPPAHMSWTTLPQLRFKEHEIEAAARGVFQQVAINYRTKPPTQIKQQTYGDLTGYEATFRAEPDKIPMDVRVFCGHREGKPAIVMQVVTLRDKLPHLSEHVRRSWTHLRYLN